MLYDVLALIRSFVNSYGYIWLAMVLMLSLFWVAYLGLILTFNTVEGRKRTRFTRMVILGFIYVATVLTIMVEILIVGFLYGDTLRNWTQYSYIPDRLAIYLLDVSLTGVVLMVLGWISFNAATHELMHLEELQH